MLETKEEEEHRQYQGTGGIQVTFAQPFKKKKRVSNYRKPGGNTFQELKDNIDFEKLCVRHVGGDCHAHSSVLQTTYFPFKTKLK